MGLFVPICFKLEEILDQFDNPLVRVKSFYNFYFMPEVDRWYNDKPDDREPIEIYEARIGVPYDIIAWTGFAVIAIMSNNTDWERVQVMGQTVIVPLALGLAAVGAVLSAARQGIMIRNYWNWVARRNAKQWMV
mgnify:CR=1 FL=1